MTHNDPVHIQLATPERWADLVDLFGPERGASGGCWCMWPFLRGRDWKAMTRDERAMHSSRKWTRVRCQGFWAYRGDLAVGWIALGPRVQYLRFQLGKTTQPLPDDSEQALAATYAVTCFFIRNGHRKTGLMSVLLDAGIGHAKAQGAHQLDACPMESESPFNGEKASWV